MVKKPTPKTLHEQVQDLLEKHIDTTGAILDDYVADKGMITELAECDKNLRSDIDDLFDEEQDFDSLLKRLQEMDLDTDQTEKLMDLFDTGDLSDRLTRGGYVYVKVDNLADQMKLETWLKTRLYPNYNEQREKLFF